MHTWPTGIGEERVEVARPSNISLVHCLRSVVKQRQASKIDDDNK